MTVEGWPIENAGAVVNAVQYRQLFEAVAVAFGDTGAATSATGLEVIQRAAGANMSVDVRAGGVLIPGTQETHQGFYHLHNTSAVNVAIAAADGTHPRIDLVVAKVRDSEYSGSTDAGSIEVYTGTPAASPVEPSVGTNSYVLARVDVPAGATSITTARITDRRDILGGQLVATDDARLSDTRTPTNGTVTEAKLATAAVSTLKLGQKSRCVVYRTSADSTPDGTWDQVDLSGESVDTDSYHASGPGITVHESVGGWFTGWVAVQFASNSTGVRGVRIKVDGTVLEGHTLVLPNAGGSDWRAQLHIAANIGATADQVVTVEVFQNSGGALNRTDVRLMLQREGT